MTVKEARQAGRLLMITYAAEAIKREVARAGQAASPQLTRAIQQLDAAMAGQATAPAAPY